MITKFDKRLVVINLKFDNLQESLKKYEFEIEDAKKYAVPSSARASSRARTANSQRSRLLMCSDDVSGGQVTYRTQNKHN